MSRINAEKLREMLEQKLRDGPHRTDIIGAYEDLQEARTLIKRMKDQMEVEVWKRGGIVNFPPFYRAAIADAVKFLKEEDDG